MFIEHNLFNLTLGAVGSAYDASPAITAMMPGIDPITPSSPDAYVGCRVSDPMRTVGEGIFLKMLIASCDRILELRPKITPALAARGNAQYRLGRYQEAI